MKAHLDYKNIIQELTSNKNIDIKKCKIWLDKYIKLYAETLLYYSCSSKEPKLPCFCESRKIDCLFLDFYKLLKTNIYEIELEKFTLRLRIGKENNEYKHLILNVEKTTGNKELR